MAKSPPQSVVKRIGTFTWRLRHINVWMVLSLLLGFRWRNKPKQWPPVKLVARAWLAQLGECWTVVSEWVKLNTRQTRKGLCCLSEVSSWSCLGKTVWRKNLLLRKKEKTVKQTETSFSRELIKTMLLWQKLAGSLHCFRSKGNGFHLYKMND